MKARRHFPVLRHTPEATSQIFAVRSHEAVRIKRLSTLATREEPEGTVRRFRGVGIIGLMAPAVGRLWHDALFQGLQVPWLPDPVF